jgi:predicted amidohydrolase
MVQADLAWHDAEANLDRFGAVIGSLDDKPDLVVLPEMFTTGFTMQAREHAEEMSGCTVARLLEWARTIEADVAGSIIVREGGRYYNRLAWARPDGRILTYDKRHLFRMAGEQEVYSAGDRKILIELKGWNLRPFICYDLRFPVWSRNVNNEYDAAVYVANWPAQRAQHWSALLKARAIENQCYVIGVNRVGTDGNGTSYGGGSIAVDFEGKAVLESTNEECARTVSLSYDRLDEYRRSFPAWKDADGFTLA